MPLPTDDASLERARNHIATLALSIFQINRLPPPSPEVLGNVVSLTAAGMNLDQLRHPEDVSASIIGQIGQYVLSATEAARRPVNIYSADAANGVKAGDASGKSVAKAIDPLDQLRSGAAAVREAASGTVTERSASGARFDDLGAMDWGSPAGLARMREFAVQKGLPWAANSPELLRLGPAAIKTLAEVHFKQETFQRLTTDAAFKAKDVVTLARFAQERHIDSNTLGTSVATAEKGLTPEEKTKLNGALLPYMKDWRSPEKQQKANSAIDDVEHAHPEKHQELEKLREVAKLKRAELAHEKNATEDKRRGASDEAHRTAEKGSRAAAEIHHAEEKKSLASGKEVKAAAKIETASIKTAKADETAKKASTSTAAKNQSKAALGAELG